MDADRSKQIAVSVVSYGHGQLIANLLQDMESTEIGTAPIAADWVAGMFLMFSTRAFGDIAGFDERFYNILRRRRLRERGQGVWLIPSVTVNHDAAAKAVAIAGTCGGASLARPVFLSRTERGIPWARAILKMCGFSSHVV